jgi:hypothetical protein
MDCYGLAMDNSGYLYVSNTEKNVVLKWDMASNRMDIVAGGNGKGNHLKQLNSPTYIFVDQDW